MAHANKRISVILGIVAFLFILTIILLIIPYEGPSYDSSSSDSHKGKEGTHTSTSTTSTTTQKVITDSVSSTSTSFTTKKTSPSTTLTSTSLQGDTPNTTSEASTSKHSTTTAYTETTEIVSITTSPTSEASTPKHSTTTAYTETTEIVSITSSPQDTSEEGKDATSDASETYTTSTDATTDMSTTYSSDSDQSTEITTTYSSVESTSVSIEEPTLRYETFNTSISDNAASKQVAARMLHLMNHSADPCQDFYEYSCGNGVDNPYLSPVNPKDAAMNRIKAAVLSSPAENSAHVLYDSCMNKETPSKEDRINYILKLVLDIGEIDPRPELAKKITSSYEYLDNTFNLTTVLATMMKHHFTPFFDLILDVDDKNTSQFVLKLTPPLFHSPLTENIRQHTCLENYYQKMDKKSTSDLDELYKDFKKCATESGIGITAFAQGTLASVKKINLLQNFTEEIRKKILQSVQFDVRDQYAQDNILQIFPEPSDLRRRLINRDYTPYTLWEMDNGYGDFSLQLRNFSWHGLVEELLERKVDPEAIEVQVYFPEEISTILYELDFYLEGVDESQRFRNVLLEMWSHYLDSNILKPVGHTPHTEDYCLHLVTELLPDITSQLYLNSFDQDILKAQMTKVEGMVESIKTAIKNQLNGKSSIFVEGIKQKIDSMKFDIGRELLGDSLVSNDIEPLSETDFPSNVIQLLKRSRRIHYSFLDKAPNVTSVMWQHSNLPYSTSGSTLYPLNTVLIPIGILESPFYEHGVPDFINYAGLGKILSNEMMHAFDSTGVKYEFSTNLDASNIVISSETCQKEQLNNVHTLEIDNVLVNFSLPAELLVNEALSDSSSVLLAWRAYLTSTKTEIPETEDGASKGGRRNDLVTKLSEVPKQNTTYNVETLPLMDSDPLKQFYIRAAQVHCEKSSKVNIMKLKENEHLPGSLRINHMAKNDKLFQQAFGCEHNAPMINSPQCSYIPLNNS